MKFCGSKKMRLIVSKLLAIILKFIYEIDFFIINMKKNVLVVI